MELILAHWKIITTLLGFVFVIGVAVGKYIPMLNKHDKRLETFEKRVQVLESNPRIDGIEVDEEGRTTLEVNGVKTKVKVR